VAKSLSAADMMGRTRSPVPSQLVALSPSNPVDEAPSNPVDQTTGRLGTERYEKTSAFVTPEQRQWLRTTARGLPQGLSASDLVRLALDQLQEAVENGFPLVQALTERAHLDVQRFEGRRNRGLPRRPVD
jgi:hypothetical protein